MKNAELTGQLRQLLYAAEISALLERLETAVRETTDEQEKESLAESLGYYTENDNALLGYYDRGVEIPPTAQPGVIHHARLGSMESNVFTLIGNWMKRRCACRSIRESNHLALLLCRRHSILTDDFFSELLPLPKTNRKSRRTRELLSVPRKSQRLSEKVLNIIVTPHFPMKYG